MQTASPLGGQLESPSKERIAELVRAAHDYVLRVLSVSIDTSEESLAFVDHYLRGARGGALAKNDAALVLVAGALGVHLGEVAIGKFGGEWQCAAVPALTPGEALGFGGGGGAGAQAGFDVVRFRVRLRDVPLVFDPIGMAAEALREGPVPGFEAGMDVPVEFSGALNEALARISVTDEEYYSLTGRLEGLEVAVDVLAELLRQKAEREEPPTVN